MSTINAPAPVKQTDEESILGALADGMRRSERNTSDPRTWISVGDASAAWSGATTYAAGDLVMHGTLPTALIFQSLQSGNTNHEPGVALDSTSWWNVVGPPFQSGFFNAGSTKVPLRYRFLRSYDPSNTQVSIEIEGSVSGGGLGLPIFTLLYPQWQPNGLPGWVVALQDFDLHLTACDDESNMVVVTIQQSGSVVLGFV